MKIFLSSTIESQKIFIHLTKIAGVIAIFSNTACMQKPDASNLKIDAGQSINTTSKNKVEGVFFSMTQKQGSSSGGACTGTAVSTTTAITAAHCVVKKGEPIDKDTGKVNGKQYCISNSIYKKVCSTEIYAHPDYVKLEKQDGKGTDFAWVVFPQGTFKYIFSMNAGTVEVGDQVVFVGYSEAKLASSNNGSKRFGWNRVERLLASDRNDIFSRYGGKFENVAVSPGDSGGPMLKNCQVTGVASRMTEGGQKQSIHTNLTHPDSVATLKAAGGGAYFCGISGSDESFCPAAITYKPQQNFTTSSREFPCVVDAAQTLPEPQPDASPSNTGPDQSSSPQPQPQSQPQSQPQTVPQQQSKPPASTGHLDCNKDYLTIRKGGQGICLNRSSGFCYRYGNRDVLYGQGRVACN